MMCSSGNSPASGDAIDQVVVRNSKLEQVRRQSDTCTKYVNEIKAKGKTIIMRSFKGDDLAKTTITCFTAASFKLGYERLAP